VKTLPNFLFLIASTALTASAAHAADPYAGVSLATPGEARINAGPGATLGNDNHPAAFKLYAGLRFSPEWSVEAGYGAFGSWRFSDPAPGAVDSARIASNAFTVAARYTVDLGEAVSVFAKLGLAANRFRYSDSAGQSARGSFVRPLWGFGAELKLSKELSVPLEFESFGKGRTALGEFHQRKLELGLRYQF
jgi:OOP family OmpA-OmpF porin